MLCLRREPRRAPFVVTAVLGLPSVLMGAGCAQIIGIQDLPEIQDGGSEDPLVDARPAIDGAPVDVPDASPACAGDEVRLELRIGGAAATEGSGPYAQVLLGDLVEISAAGSCAGAGEVSYEWSFSPAEGIEATAAPALAGSPEAFTVYPTAAGDYQVTLTVRAPSGASQTRSVVAIRAHAWQEADVDPALGMGVVRDMSVGGDNLWIAAGGGAYALPLAGPTNAFARVQHSGDQVPNDLEVVLFDPRTDFLWFGRRPNDDGLYRLNMVPNPPASVKIEFDGAEALDGDAETRDIVADGTNTIVITTNQGIAAVDGDEIAFSGQIQPDGQNPEALAFPRGRRMAGSRGLYDLDTSGVFDLGVGGPDNKIRAMAADEADEVLWIGTDGEGVVTFDLRTNMVLERFTDGSALESDIVRALLVESAGPHAGDVWIATSDGVSRYISRRQTWLNMDEDQGLAGNLDLTAIAIDTSENRRVLYAGSSSGVVYIGAP
jgi:hypothetical protein